jgi:PIN domain nuclease of toxin-antitoxin system
LKLLLDTHIWIATGLDPDRLKPRVARALQSQKNRCWLSSVSVWELILLVEKGRVELDQAAVPWVRENLSRTPIREAPLTHDVALAANRLNVPDPADRLIAATAKVMDLTLVTGDKRLLKLRGIKTLANR